MRAILLVVAFLTGIVGCDALRPADPPPSSTGSGPPEGADVSLPLAPPWILETSSTQSPQWMQPLTGPGAGFPASVSFAGRVTTASPGSRLWVELRSWSTAAAADRAPVRARGSLRLDVEGSSIDGVSIPLGGVGRTALAVGARLALVVWVEGTARVEIDPSGSASTTAWLRNRLRPSDTAEWTLGSWTALASGANVQLTLAPAAPPSCWNGVRDSGEADVDCGGPCEAVCAVGRQCLTSMDCQSGSCESARCARPVCANRRLDASETGLDCGGVCGGCAAGGTCLSTADCRDGLVCADAVGVWTGTCRTPECIDATGHVRCGDSCGKCAPPSTCSDKRRSGRETDVDCGGPDCGSAGKTCAALKACKVSADCASSRCVNGVCRPSTCDDGVRSTGETDVDCGGPCDVCVDGRSCVTARDCASAVCLRRICAAPSPKDRVRNASETAVDCGGISAPPCAVGKTCLVDGDCASGVCTGGSCRAPSCTDGHLNGRETGVDCGGACASCAAWIGRCRSDLQCRAHERCRGFRCEPACPALDEACRARSCARGTPPACRTGAVGIPGGTFIRGDDAGSSDERPAARIEVVAFCMDRTEVTNAAYLRDGGAPIASEGEWSVDRRALPPQAPVAFITWTEATAYCAARGGRLPSESEWEWAARGCDARPYPWGSALADCARADLLDCGTQADTVDNRPTGSSPWGVLGLSGGVWEWTRDTFSTYPGFATIGMAWNRPDQRVARGGGWRSEPALARTTTRGRLLPSVRDPDLGFRCVYDVGR